MGLAWAAAWFAIGPVRVELGEELIGRGCERGEAGNDETAHLAVALVEDGLRLRLEGAGQADGQRGVCVLAAHGTIMT